MPHVQPQMNATVVYINESYSEGEITWEENGELVRGINIIEEINAHMQTDDHDNEARIVSIYHTRPVDTIRIRG